jgi:hypothetical protein
MEPVLPAEPEPMLPDELPVLLSDVPEELPQVEPLVDPPVLEPWPVVPLEPVPDMEPVSLDPEPVDPVVDPVEPVPAVPLDEPLWPLPYVSVVELWPLVAPAAPLPVVALPVAPLAVEPVAPALEPVPPFVVSFGTSVAGSCFGCAVVPLAVLVAPLDPVPLVLPAPCWQAANASTATTANFRRSMDPSLTCKPGKPAGGMEPPGGRVAAPPAPARGRPRGARRNTRPAPA